METSTILVGVTVILVSYLFHKYFIKIYDYWPKRGVPCMEGTLPFFGNTLPIMVFRKDMSDFGLDIYNANRSSSMIGFYQNRKPNLLIRDPELIKTVLVSAFPNFHVNFLSIDPELDPLLAKNPFFVHGEEWKKRRTYLSNALMSSKKLKLLCMTVGNVCVKFTKYLEDNMKKSNGVYEVETKELFTRFTGEVVATVGFGVEGEFFNNDSKPNSFRETVHGSLDQTFASNVIFTVVFLAPVLNKVLRCRFLPKSIDRFFRRVTNQMIAARKNDGIARNDFLQLMMDAHKNENGEIDEGDITASATSFFIDGYETSAITLLFFAYQVAVHPPVQDKLRSEVNAVLKKHGGEISYESLNEMTYMDQALNESMRILPAFGILAKRCNQQYKLVGNDGIECVVEPGTDVVLPVEALHKDPKYWENPETYDPDRFATESKNERSKNVFLPFGDGPRICVGQRFATMQMKAAMATMLRCCSLELSSKTKLPLEFTHAPLKAVQGGLWITLKPLI